MDESVESPVEQPSQEVDRPSYSLPIHFKFRFTFPHQDASSIEQYPRDVKKPQVTKITRTILNVLVPRYTTELTHGLEFFNSKQEPTYLHTHFHFVSTFSRDTIAKALFRALDKGDFTFKGPKVFSLKPEVVVDPPRFWRYPLKQIPPDSKEKKEWNFARCSGFSLEKLEEMRHVAHEQWKIASEIKIKKSDNKESPDTLFERLFSICEKDISKNDTKKGQEHNLKWFQKAVLRFYVSENRPLNFQVMSGYAHLLAFKFGAESEDDMLKRFN